MSDFYYDDHRRGRSNYNTTDDYYRRSSFPRPPYDSYNTPRRGSQSSTPSQDLIRYNESHSRRNSNRDLVSYNPNLARESTNTHAHSRSRSRPRQRSLPPSHLRRGSDSDSSIGSSYAPRSQYPRDYDRERDHDHEHEHHHDHHHHSGDGHHHHSEHRSEHHRAKNAAATILGGIVGEQAAKRGAHGNRLAEVAGVLVGAWGGHELEKGWERRER